MMVPPRDSQGNLLRIGDVVSVYLGKITGTRFIKLRQHPQSTVNANGATLVFLNHDMCVGQHRVIKHNAETYNDAIMIIMLEGGIVHDEVENPVTTRRSIL